VVEDDAVFKALADPTRRALLDRLRERNGQTLGELCEPLDMARQSATQHLGLLEAANLVTTVRRGREKLHYLNPVPLWDIAERWIEKFERPRLRALSAIRRRAEEDTMAERPDYVYVTYIESTPERVWNALTDADLTAAYWGHSNVSDWQVGSLWEHRRVDGSGIADVAGTVLESAPPRRLAMTFDAPGAAPPQGPSRVTFDIEPYHDHRLTVTHENVADERAGGHPAPGPPCSPTSSRCSRPATPPARAVGDARRAARGAAGLQRRVRAWAGSVTSARPTESRRVSLPDTSTGPDTGRTWMGRLPGVPLTPSGATPSGGPAPQPLSSRPLKDQRVHAAERVVEDVVRDAVEGGVHQAADGGQLGGPEVGGVGCAQLGHAWVASAIRQYWSPESSKSESTSLSPASSSRSRSSATVKGRNETGYSCVRASSPSSKTNAMWATCSSCRRSGISQA
jgi:DNA-binding transcriptional ArsR family regulator/uncharacterized protein YndB with AHSA1/START domain